MATQVDKRGHASAKTPAENTPHKDGPQVQIITVQPSTVIQTPEEIIKRDESLRGQSNGRKVAANVL